MHIVFTISNESSVPYFNWFAKKSYDSELYTFSFIVMCKNKPKMIEDVGQFGYKCFWIPYDNNKRKRGMMSVLFKAYKLFRRLDPDVVHTHLFDDSLPCLFAARLAGVKIRAIVKADTGFHYFHKPQYVIADKFNNFNATHIIPPSNESKRFIIEKEKANPKKITMIHHGIPVNFFSSPNEQYRRDLVSKFGLEGKVVLGTVSRLIDWKGYKYIIAAAAQTVERYPNARFLFVGTGPQEKQLKELVVKHDIEGYVVFTGWIPREYIPSLYSLLDGYVHAASYEPFGFVIPEAMISGVPIVSTPTGAALDIIEHKENGYLAKYKDVQSLVDGVEFIIKHGSELKAKGRMKAIEMFDFNKMYDNYIRLYETNSESA